MKALVIGASGQVGTELMRLLSASPDTPALGTYASHPQPGLERMDITDTASVATMFDNYEPDTVFLCSAMPHVDACEEKPALTRKVNVEGAAKTAAACASRGARLVFVSTDYVFDGEKGNYTEEDTPRPINVYGQSKLDAESRVLALCRNAAVARTAMVYSYNTASPNFAMQLLNNDKKGAKMRVAEDMYANPTYAPDLAMMLLKLALSGQTGIFHAAGSQRVSRLEFALKACEVLGLNKSFIEPVAFAQLTTKAARPLDSSLDISKLRAALGHEPLGAKAGLSKFKKALAEAKE